MFKILSTVWLVVGLVLTLAGSRPAKAAEDLNFGSFEERLTKVEDEVKSLKEQVARLSGGFSTTAPKTVQYRQVCRDGVCSLEPVEGGSVQTYQSPTYGNGAAASCSNGQCSTVDSRGTTRTTSTPARPRGFFLRR